MCRRRRSGEQQKRVEAVDGAHQVGVEGFVVLAEHERPQLWCVTDDGRHGWFIVIPAFGSLWLGGESLQTCTTRAQWAEPLSTCRPHSEMSRLGKRAR